MFLISKSYFSKRGFSISIFLCSNKCEIVFEYPKPLLRYVVTAFIDLYFFIKFSLSFNVKKLALFFSIISLIKIDE